MSNTHGYYFHPQAKITSTDPVIQNPKSLFQTLEYTISDQKGEDLCSFQESIRLYCQT